MSNIKDKNISFRKYLEKAGVLPALEQNFRHNDAIGVNPVTLQVCTDVKKPEDVEKERQMDIAKRIELMKKKPSSKQKDSKGATQVKTGVNIIFEIFKYGDEDGNKAIKVPDLVAVLDQMEDRHKSFRECKRELKERAKKEPNSRVELAEFIDMFLYKILKTIDEEEDVDHAFQVFDPSESGFIPAEVLRKNLTSIGDQFNADEMNQFITEADISNDALINYNEFSTRLFDKQRAFDEKWPSKLKQTKTNSKPK